jgi:hypothetical protein
MDRSGGDYKQQQTWTQDACMQACAADLECVSAQFVATTGYYYMKSASNALTTNDDVQTIDCGPTLSLNYECTTVPGYSTDDIQISEYVAVTPQLTDSKSFPSHSCLRSFD